MTITFAPFLPSWCISPPLILYRSLLSAVQVTKGQFRRALDQARLTVPGEGAPPSDLLTTKEVEVLSKRYEVKRRNGKGGVGGGGVDGDLGDGETEVNYGKLCEQVEKVNHQLCEALVVIWKGNCRLLDTCRRCCKRLSTS